MSAEANNDNSIGAEIDALFQETLSVNVKGRIQLAAYAISEQVHQFDAAKKAQDSIHEGIPSASRNDMPAVAYDPYLLYSASKMSAEQEKDDVDRVIALFEDHEELVEPIELFSPTKKAELALKASIQGIRTVHNLSRFQANRAIKYSREKL